MRIFITGISGTGKSELVKEFNKRGIDAFDMDERLCDWKNKKTGKKAKYYQGLGEEWIENHSWICNKEKLERLLNKNYSLIIIAGRSSNQKDFLKLFDKIFLLQCKEKTLLYRLNNRKGNSFGKDYSEKKKLLDSYKDFERKMIKRGAKPINSEKPIKEIVDEVLK